ncbi:sulfur carrier protein ThiS [Halomonas caseinilytica]|uniref:Sulfur carrier protein ThiS n=1 Tax=Halomonas caseinilytica TaxID=438744 RepID=A0A1M6W424_9GAMM|nr:sulfur carrier protein ThiS [Halomonas caseinilytica]SEM80178.1 sulfur carrier protein ThiS [Halomonas caseinilytica]SHK88534.1 sulfur carrier protein ThiS [Halomonas caseinilytica]
MQIHLNGEAKHLDSEMSVAQLVDTLGLTGRRIAVEVNEEIVPKSIHGDTRLADGDRVEIVHAIGGG